MKHKTPNLLKLFVLIVAVAMVATLGIGTLGTAFAATDDAAEVQYYGAGATTLSLVGSSSETIRYTSRTITESIPNNNNYPKYYNGNMTSYPNACAPVAGATLIGFYDKGQTGLIPDFTPGMQRTGYYYYLPMTYVSSTIQNVIADLYNRMGTNSVQNGTSRPDFLNGLRSYASSKGYTMHNTSVMSGTTINFSALKAQIDAGRTVSLYVDDYGFATYSDQNNAFTLYYSHYTAKHIMQVFGYRKIDFYNGGSTPFRTVIMLRVEAGLGSSTADWYCVGAYGELDAADSIYFS